MGDSDIKSIQVYAISGDAENAGMVLDIIEYPVKDWGMENLLEHMTQWVSSHGFRKATRLERFPRQTKYDSSKATKFEVLGLKDDGSTHVPMSEEFKGKLPKNVTEIEMWSS